MLVTAFMCVCVVCRPRHDCHIKCIFLLKTSSNTSYIVTDRLLTYFDCSIKTSLFLDFHFDLLTQHV